MRRFCDSAIFLTCDTQVWAGSLSEKPEGRRALGCRETAAPCPDRKPQSPTEEPPAAGSRGNPKTRSEAVNDVIITLL